MNRDNIIRICNHRLVLTSEVWPRKTRSHTAWGNTLVRHCTLSARLRKTTTTTKHTTPRFCFVVTKLNFIVSQNGKHSVPLYTNFSANWNLLSEILQTYNRKWKSPAAMATDFGLNTQPVWYARFFLFYFKENSKSLTERRTVGIPFFLDRLVFSQAFLFRMIPTIWKLETS